MTNSAIRFGWTALICGVLVFAIAQSAVGKIEMATQKISDGMNEISVGLVD